MSQNERRCFYCEKPSTRASFGRYVCDDDDCERQAYLDKGGCGKPFEERDYPFLDDILKAVEDVKRERECDGDTEFEERRKHGKHDG